MSVAFDTPLQSEGNAIVGPWRKPLQMLDAQSYDGHASIHDDATAQKLGFRGGTIEGPTHFSQFDPLCYSLWGSRWFQTGCISSHFRNPVFEGEEVRAIVERPVDGLARIRMEKRDGIEVLQGTVSVGIHPPPSALEQRLRELKPLERPVILRDVEVGMRSARTAVSMSADQFMGDLYPFSLSDKLRRITERSRLYDQILPIEMLSVLMNYTAREAPFPARGPTVSLFADQEIRLLDGPVEVGRAYEIDREVVALSGSRRTESMWVRTRLFALGGTQPVAIMLLNTASLKASYADYEAQHRQLYGASGHE